MIYKRKALSKFVIEGAFFIIIKTIFEKLFTSTILSIKRMESFPPRSGTRQVCSKTLFNIILKPLSWMECKWIGKSQDTTVGIGHEKKNSISMHKYLIQYQDIKLIAFVHLNDLMA